jgi:RNA polymerase sigma-70 factor (ECF subfamily)
VDERFWREAFRAHGPFLLRVVERLSGPGGHVEEIVQETFALAFSKGGPQGGALPEGSALRGWLYRVAANKVLHHRRSVARFLGFRERAAREPHEGAHRPDDVVAASDDRSLVRVCVGRLPFKLRETFVLYELEGLSSVEIAAALDISENTARSRLRLARERFRAELDRRARKAGRTR